MADKRCRTCRLYDLPAVLSTNGRVLNNCVARCLWEPPAFLLPSSISWDHRSPRTSYMEPNDGTECPCWEDRNG